MYFDSSQRHITFEKTSDPTVNHLIRVVGVSPNAGSDTGKVRMTHRKYGTELGKLINVELVDVVRHAIEVAMGLRS